MAVGIIPIFKEKSTKKTARKAHQEFCLFLAGQLQKAYNQDSLFVVFY
jgi:hypothetical protein